MKTSQIERLIGESGLAPHLSLNSNSRVDSELVELNFHKINYHKLLDDNNELKFPFGTVVSFDVSHCNLKSMKNFPLECCGSLRATYNNFTSIEGIPSKALIMDLRYCPIKSFKGIGTKVKSCTSLWMPAIESHMLGVLQIKDLQSLYIQVPDVSLDAYKAFEIILKYIDPDKRDILLCQDELFDAGLKEYARL